jgi:hypothetical protein
MYYLPQITNITNENENHATIFVNNLTHDPVFFEAPDYKPSDVITNNGNSPLANEEFFHVNMVSFLLLSKYFNYLIDNDVYNNTRIILVSDHGAYYEGTFKLPGGLTLCNFNSLLMVKDFDSKFDLNTNETFMTIADVPHVTASGLIKNMVNPFTHKELSVEKHNGAVITTAREWSPSKMLRYSYDIKDNEWLHVKDNIFDINNWSLVIDK